MPLQADFFAPGTAEAIGLGLALPTLYPEPAAGAAPGAPSLHSAVNPLTERLA
jgi:hypothetical protein